FARPPNTLYKAVPQKCIIVHIKRPTANNLSYTPSCHSCSSAYNLDTGSGKSGFGIEAPYEEAQTNVFIRARVRARACLRL
ncbi:MAG: hypothetical protein JW892_16850, partial [Anaerolineae bacterium]|nr:hypothetical protein [Anaerolineae bacterium]